MSNSYSPNSANIALDTALCGRETGDGGFCGAPSVVWAAFDSDDWAGYQASACTEHSDELLSFPGARVTSDAPLEVGEDLL